MNTEKQVLEGRLDGTAMGVRNDHHRASAPCVQDAAGFQGFVNALAIDNPLIRPPLYQPQLSKRRMERMMELPDLLLSASSTESPPRLLHVRVPAATHEFIRHTAFSQRATNATVVAWAVELLRRYIQAGGQP